MPAAEHGAALGDVRRQRLVAVDASDVRVGLASGLPSVVCDGRLLHALGSDVHAATDGLLRDSADREVRRQESPLALGVVGDAPPAALNMSL